MIYVQVTHSDISVVITARYVVASMYATVKYKNMSPQASPKCTVLCPNLEFRMNAF